jgi:hypothetical protein
LRCSAVATDQNSKRHFSLYFCLARFVCVLRIGAIGAPRL